MVRYTVELGGGWQYVYKCTEHYVKDQRKTADFTTSSKKPERIIHRHLIFEEKKVTNNFLTIVSSCQFTDWLVTSSLSVILFLIMEIWRLLAVIITVSILACSVQGMSITLNKEHWISKNLEVWMALCTHFVSCISKLRCQCNFMLYI